ncbi:dynein axonemal heavy chain 8 [Hyperolius riggenbachi]|uniref:dynein axonemal heavy chain 8 n=1 Tax=Hyperolius riggenbachi TaxID=752182 RepID=UPI0035A28E0A
MNDPRNPVSDGATGSDGLEGNETATSSVGIAGGVVAADCTAGSSSIAIHVIPELHGLEGSAASAAPADYRTHPSSKAHTKRRLSKYTSVQSEPIERNKSALKVASSISYAAMASANLDQKRLSFQRSASGFQRLQETLKGKQAKYKEERERRRDKINSLYKYILSTVAQKLDLGLDAVEELLLDAPSFQDIDNFFSIGGRRSLVFFYQESTVPGIECGRIFPGVSKGAKMMRLFLGTLEERLQGLCLVFIRCSSDTLITDKNIHEEIHFSVLDATEGIFTGFSNLLSGVFLPAITATQNWGAVKEPADVNRVKKSCQEAIAQYLASLADAKANIEDAVLLKHIDSINFSKLSSFDGVKAAAADPDMVSLCEGALMTWYKQIEQVVTESELIRRKADSSNPFTELEYWKKKSVKFNFIIEQIKGQNFKSVVMVLHISRSKVLKMWRVLDARITDMANEAKENTKFLHTLEQCCTPLYDLNLASMAESMHKLMNALGMIHSFSRYYNTSEQITSLFVKVTNQMVMACRAYMTNSGKNSIWEQDTDTVLQRIQDCIFLFNEYQSSFHKTQECYVDHPFDVSEKYIFGEFKAFCKRIEKIAEVLTVTQNYSLLNRCANEGLDALNVKIKHIFETIRKKPYDILDFRKTEFDEDFADFTVKMQGLEAQIQAFMRSSFDRILSTQKALELLQRFQKLNIPCLKLESSSAEGRILQHYVGLLEATKKTYQLQKEDPLVARNMPPVTGKILWARHLFRRINQPITYLNDNSDILSSPEGTAAVRLYNRISYALVELEVLYHKAWVADIIQLKLALQATLFIHHPETKELLVNFDPNIRVIIRETKCMMKLGLEVPAEALQLLAMEENLMANHKKLQLLLRNYKDLYSLIHPLFAHLMIGPVKKVESVLRRGVTLINWSSLRLGSFIKEAFASMQEYRQLINQVSDICEQNINVTTTYISETTFLQLPDDGVTTVQHMLSNNEVYTAYIAEHTNQKCKQVKRAVNALIAIFQSVREIKQKKSTVKGHKKPETKRVAFTTVQVSEENKFTKECKEIHSHYKSLLIESLQTSTRLSLDLLRRMLISRMGETPALLKAEVHLVIPNIVLIPSLDDIQQAINRIVQLIMDVNRGVAEWEEDDNSSDVFSPQILASVRAQVTHGDTVEGAFSGHTSVNVYSSVVEHSEVSRLASLLSSAMHSPVSLLRKSAKGVLQSFNKYNALWAEDKESQIKKFLDEEPSISDFRSEIMRYVTLQLEINRISPAIRVGFIELDTEPVKSALCAEAKVWNVLLCRYLHEAYKGKMMEASDYISEYLKRLARPILDLDDLRFAVETLANIRDTEIHLERTLGPIEESYAILHKLDMKLTREEMEVVDTIKYSFSKLLSEAVSVQNKLFHLQPKFKKRLLEAIAIFHQHMAEFNEAYEKEGPMISDIPPHEIKTRVQLFQARMDSLWKKSITYSSGEELFGLPVTCKPELLDKKRKELALLQKLYSLHDAVTISINGYYDTLWMDIDIKKISTELQDFQSRCYKLPKALKTWQTYLDLKKAIDDFSTSCPLLEMMADKAMKKRHWDRISDLTGHLFPVESDSFHVRNIMEAPILQYKEDIEDICISAVKEKDIEARLKQVMEFWKNQFISFSTFKGRGELLIKGVEATDIMAAAADSLMTLGSLMNNRYNLHFKGMIHSWIHNLSVSSAIIEEWLQVQNLWVYLEAVFMAGDIAKQLPQEAKRFKNIDKTWEKMMQRAHDFSNVVRCCAGDETMQQLLPHLREQLEVCQKSLTGYLEKKRLVFPRFFFVSDPVLLEILGKASDSHSIQPHLPALSDNINEVEFSVKDYDRVLSVVSREGERIQLESGVQARGPVEVWLGELLRLQRSSLHGVIRSAYYQLSEEGFQLISFLTSYPAQVGLLGIQILWTRDSQEALSNAKEDRKIMEVTNRRFLGILNSLISQTTQNLKKFERVKYETLITIHVHQRDIFNELVKMAIKSVTDFEWQKQSRFYYREDLDQVLVSITDVNFVYQNEFLGCTDRLAITPLTDRCYITLAQAVGMNMGGAPAGPAGTGKTETVKDMGKALGKYVVVFNCSDQMDFRGLGRIFKGLAQSGSWGCFDEFNRIDLPVLSVAAQQIHIVLTARRERRKQFLFSDGDNVDLNPQFGIFLTMNPGYAGRQELPENLKMQFRTVSMMVPDRQIIMRVKLASCGFLDNVPLSQKFYVLYRLCEEQLTKQVHYDFGLRNILSVLRTLGEQKRARPEESESSIVMRVLRDMNLSKLIDEDEPLFLSLINDLFPGMQLDSVTYTELQNAVSNQAEGLGLVNHPPWNLKLVQLYETARVRHGLMALGPSGSGKSTIINVLMKAMTECGSPHRDMRMNPKSITASQMFGRLDSATNDWTDGIFSTLWRRTLKTKKGENVWIVLDGPVDAIWIENLNSVLDDNKTLTLANGDRIPMAPMCKLLFEVHSIENASPATVSRMGMVYISSSTLTWRPLLKAWLNKRSAREGEVLQALYEQVFQDAYTYMLTDLNPRMQLLECNYMVQTINLLQGCIERGGTAEPRHLHRLFVFALMWSLGALLELDSRDRLETFLRSHLSKLDLPEAEPGSCQPMFEFLVNENGDWEHWSKRVPEYIYPTDHVPVYTSLLVPNMDNVRTLFLIDCIAKQQKAVLLMGEPGTGKTVMVRAYMKRYNIETHVSKSLNFSSGTRPVMFQRTMEGLMEKRVGNTLGPPGGRKMALFIDDINMPVVNDWGDQVTNELVRQVMEMQGMYSLDKPGDFTNIADVQIMAAMIHPGGGRNDIPQRLKRHFTIFNCTLPSDVSIDKIFGIIASGYFHPCRKFNPDVCDLVQRLVAASRALWQLTKVKMLPTPSKFHYIFNLRDLSRIWQGMTTIRAEECPSVSVLLALFKHECQRVISDRFVSREDRHWFDLSFAQIIQEQLDPSLASGVQNDVYFVDFLREAPEPTGDEPEDFVFQVPKVYEMVPSFEFLSEKLQQYQNKLNDSVRGSHMDLVFFTDAMTHLIKISRIIRTACGNALLVGVGGSGKQSLARLASFIAGYKIFQITLMRSYGVSNLMEDLKLLYRTAGEEGREISFIFTDNDIKDESFLEYINSVLSSGEVSSLFSREEVEEISQGVFPAMKKEFPHHPPTSDNLYEYFISRCRRNLHVILCFSPVGERFRSRSLKFPGLISGCTMDWFGRWPKEALVSVANHYLSGFEIVCRAEVRLRVVETMGTFHDKVSESCESYFQRYRRRTYVTPKSYLSFLSNYKSVYAEKLKYISDQAERMNRGLSKLLEASNSIRRLSQELVVKEKDLALASVTAEKVLAEVVVTTQAAASVKNAVQQVKDKAQKIVDEIEIEKKFAEGKLEVARPALEEAKAALNTIKPADISTVRKLAKPPHLIMRIMDACLLLFQRRLDPVTTDPQRPCCTPSWGESLKMMSSTGFLQNLQQFNKEAINEEMLELLEPYFGMEDYTMANAKKVCGNVAGLLSWTLAMAAFYGVNKEVLPLKANLMKQEGRLKAANSELCKAQAQLDEKQAELNKTQARFDAVMSEKMSLQNDAELCKKKMQAASTLIDGLSSERTRWTQQSLEFKSQISRLVGDVLLLTAFLSYCGPFNQTFRNILLQEIWVKEIGDLKIPFSENLSIVTMLVDQPTVSEWNLQGLPGDDLSIENGIIVTKATRYPLLIDPQAQGKTWIKSKEKDNDLQVTSLNHKYFRTHLEDSLSLGRPLLIEDVQEELDPALDNVLEKNFIKSGTTFKVKVSDKEVEVMDKFKLYITTKLPNPLFTPEIYAKTSVINFTVTQKGLENQLLKRVVIAEKQELETERIRLMEDITINRRRMKDLEDNLLYKLTATVGSLLDDESLIEALTRTKQTASNVSNKLRTAAETEAKITSTQEEYRPAATRGSVLYFLITEMSVVNVMYQTSLVQFLKLFDNSMTKSDKSPHSQMRTRSIIDYLTFEVYRYSIRGLYEKDKLLFTLLLSLKIDLQSGRAKHREFQTLIRGGAALDLKACPPKPFKWILDVTWLNLVELSKLSSFSGILNQVLRNERGWRSWCDSDRPEEEIIPDGYNESLDTFRKLLLIRSWCPDRTVRQAWRYIGDSLGARYTEPVLLNLERTWEESDRRTPLICFLSVGSDPSNQIEGLARRLKFEFHSVSMGQGQAVHARRILQTSMQQGGWVLLQNCHLGLDFMEELLETVQTMESVHEAFRVWITAEEHRNFPIALLQTSIKFSSEPPQGMRAGLNRTFTGINQDLLDVINLSMWKPMLYTVAFLHSAVQERRKFGPLGWNIPYEFNSADFTASVQFLQNHLDECGAKKAVSWSAVHYMIGEVQYGGRVTDEYDKRFLNCLTRAWFNEKMFDPSFSFYTGYKIPQCKTVEQYLASIVSLPLTDSPEVFRLHPNADITFQSHTAAHILSTITNIQPKESGGESGETRESVVYQAAQDMLNKLPPDYVPHEVKAQLLRMGVLKPMNIFLRQEIDRMQKVITAVRNTLNDLKLAIDGTIIMNESLRDALDNIYDARIPKLWRKVSWVSDTLGFWFSELLERNSQFRRWIYEGRPNVFWMTGFFNPQGFLTAMRQEVTRTHEGWALDTVTVQNDVLKVIKEEIRAPPLEGVYICGLYLDGAGWDKRNSRLTESTPKVLFAPLPVVHIYAVSGPTVRDPKLYVCPVYKKPVRTDLTYVTDMQLRTTQIPDHWILRGVALLCDIK